MKIEMDITKKELQHLRELVYQGRKAHKIIRKDVQFDYQYKYQKNMFNLGTKIIKIINSKLIKIYGHDCDGSSYLTGWRAK